MDEAAELIGTATTERDGLMAKKCYNIGVRRALILSGNNSKRLVKIVSIPKLTYIRYIVFVQGFYEIAPIFCSINIRSDSTGVFSTVLNSILPIPNNIEFYTNEANGNFNVYIMSLGQPGNISHVFVTHCAEVTYDNIGDVCDLDDTCKKLE